MAATASRSEIPLGHQTVNCPAQGSSSRPRFGERPAAPLGEGYSSAFPARQIGPAVKWDSLNRRYFAEGQTLLSPHFRQHTDIARWFSGLIVVHMLNATNFYHGFRRGLFNVLGHEAHTRHFLALVFEGIDRRVIP